MKQNYIVLSSGSTASSDPFLGPFSVRGTSPQVGAFMKVEVKQIEDRNLQSLTDRAGVVAVAPSVPMKLIAPVEISDAAPAADAIAWGVKAVGADTSPFDGDGIVVAVLDTGIDRNHPAFAGIDIVERDFTGEGNGDQHGHGTHCAGTIAGRTTDNRRIGVAPGVKRLLIGKVLGNEGGASEWIVSAMQWAVQEGANVISMSLGIDFPGIQKRLMMRLKPEPATSMALEGYRTNVQLFERMAALVSAWAPFGQATIIVAASGNESKRPEYQIAAAPPAVSSGFMCVAALDQNLKVATFSNTGVNVSGPGVGILSAKPGGGFQTMSGTSMATPHVAGVAALWAQKLKSINALSPGFLFSQVQAQATQANLQGYDFFDMGSGLVRAPQS